MKRLLLFLLLLSMLLTFPMPAFADSYLLTGQTCQACWPAPHHTISMIVMVIPGTGTFWDRGFQIPALGLLEVTNLSGTLDGAAMRLDFNPSIGDGRSWMYSPGTPGQIWFTANGAPGFRVWHDHAFSLL